MIDSGSDTTTSTTTLTSKGQITLTKAIRDRLVLKEGDRLRISVSRDGSTYTFDRELRSAEGFTLL